MTTEQADAMLTHLAEIADALDLVTLEVQNLQLLVRLVILAVAMIWGHHLFVAMKHGAENPGFWGQKERI